MIVLLVVYGTQYGTWLDEIGSSLDLEDQAAAPTILLPAMIGLLSIGLVVGGLTVGLTIPRGERFHDTALLPREEATRDAKRSARPVAVSPERNP